MTDLGTLGGTFSSAAGVNASGTIVGASTLPGEWFQHAFAYQNGAMNDLGTLGGRFSYAFAINDAGQIVGYAMTAKGEQVPFLYENGYMRKLPYLGCGGLAYAINSNGAVVGSVYGSRDQHAYFADPSTGFQPVDLNVELAHSIVGWVLVQATGISDSGAICGWGISPHLRAWLVVPHGCYFMRRLISLLRRADARISSFGAERIVSASGPGDTTGSGSCQCSRLTHCSTLAQV
jgi:probable HAF family extracellular repeat protein